MLTVKKLNIYEKYRGNEEGFFRFGKKKDQAVLTEEDWSEIEDFLHKLYLVENGLASKKFEADLKNMLSKRIDSQEVKKKLFSLIDKKWYP